MVSMKHHRSRMPGAYVYDNPFVNRTAVHSASTSSFARTFNALFSPPLGHRVYAEERASRAAFLTSLMYFSEDGSKISLSKINPQETRFSAVFNPTDIGYGTFADAGPSLAVRLDLLHPSGASSRFLSVDRNEAVGQVVIPLTDIKSLRIERSPVIRCYAFPTSVTEDDCDLDVTVELRNSQRDRYFKGLQPVNQSRHTAQYQLALLNLKKMTDCAMAITFRMRASLTAWKRLQNLQNDLGLRHEDGNSSRSFHLHLYQIQGSRHHQGGRYRDRDFFEIDDSTDSSQYDDDYEGIRYRPKPGRRRDPFRTDRYY